MAQSLLSNRWRSLAVILASIVLGAGLSLIAIHLHNLLEHGSHNAGYFSDYGTVAVHSYDAAYDTRSAQLIGVLDAELRPQARTLYDALIAMHPADLVIFDPATGCQELPCGNVPTDKVTKLYGLALARQQGREANTIAGNANNFAFVSMLFSFFSTIIALFTLLVSKYK